MGNLPDRLYTAHIAEDVQLGKNVTVVMPSNLYGCKIGNNCFIGPFVEIQKGAEIGDRTRVQSHSFVCSKVTLGVDCFVGHGTMFTNDTFSELGRPAYTEVEVWRETHIGDRVTIGSNTVLLPVTVCDDVIIGAGSVVTRNITQPGVYVGIPARRLKDLPSGYRGFRKE